MKNNNKKKKFIYRLPDSICLSCFSWAIEFCNGCIILAVKK